MAARRFVSYRVGRRWRAWLPHPPNFAPVGATSLFAGARLPVWQAYLVPLALMAITDPIVASFYGVAAFQQIPVFHLREFSDLRLAGKAAARTPRVFRASQASRF